MLSVPAKVRIFFSVAARLTCGKDLTGWRNTGESSVVRGWRVEDGYVVRNKSTPNDDGGREWQRNNLWTQGQYADFVLELEFRGAGTNTLVVRADRPIDCLHRACAGLRSAAASRAVETAAVAEVRDTSRVRTGPVRRGGGEGPAAAGGTAGGEPEP